MEHLGEDPRSLDGSRWKPPTAPSRLFHVKHDDLPELDLAAFTLGLTRACRRVSVGALTVDAASGDETSSNASAGHARLQLSPAAFRALHAHYTELRRWNRRLALIGPGTVAEVLQRHYAESLAALPLLPPPCAGPATSLRTLVDLGSGAGFPGWVLAAARPDLSALLVEARERKCTFLQAATRKAAAALRDGPHGKPRDASRAGPGAERSRPFASLPIHCLNARVGVPLPGELPPRLDVVAIRALKVARRVLAALAHRLTRDGRILLWLGAETPQLPRELTVGRERPLGGSEARRILELLPAQEPDLDEPDLKEPDPVKPIS